ncbi:MAG: lysine exporter LysO family protein, partial [Proteobacteria bacterium]|nr:lysine exporter LysO family protein [Pseudomonadota bacterium]
DTTLPVIIRFTGKEYGIISIFSGIVLTLVAPFLITFILA